MKRTEQLISQLKQLPPAPTVLIELMNSFRQADRDVDRIVTLIMHDPALTAEVLKLCNGTYFAADHPVDDVFEAVTRVGFYEVYRMVAAISCSRMFSSGPGNSALDMSHFWRHSVTCAVIAEIMAEKFEDRQGLAFTAGLLHDIGKLILASVEADAYTEVVHRPQLDEATLLQAEQNLFGTQHAELGACLLARWKLPDPLVTAVRLHHESAHAEPMDRLISCVQVGNTLAHLVQPDNSPATVAALETSDPAAFLPLRAEELPGLLSQVQGRMEKLNSLLTIGS